MQLDLLEYDFTLQNQQAKLAANAARTPMLSSEIFCVNTENFQQSIMEEKYIFDRSKS
jgi:hypothetical protein